MKEILEGIVEYGDLYSVIEDYFREVENEQVTCNHYLDGELWEFSLFADFSCEAFQLDTRPGLAKFAIERQDVVRILDWYLAKQNKELLGVEFRFEELAFKYRTNLKLNQKRRKK